MRKIPNALHKHCHRALETESDSIIIIAEGKTTRKRSISRARLAFISLGKQKNIRTNRTKKNIFIFITAEPRLQSQIETKSGDDVCACVCVSVLVRARFGHPGQHRHHCTARDLVRIYKCKTIIVRQHWCVNADFIAVNYYIGPLKERARKRRHRAASSAHAGARALVLIA